MGIWGRLPVAAHCTTLPSPDLVLQPAWKATDEMLAGLLMLTQAKEHVRGSSGSVAEPGLAPKPPDPLMGVSRDPLLLRRPEYLPPSFVALPVSQVKENIRFLPPVLLRQPSRKSPEEAGGVAVSAKVRPLAEAGDAQSRRGWGWDSFQPAGAPAARQGPRWGGAKEEAELCPVLFMKMNPFSLDDTL